MPVAATSRKAKLAEAIVSMIANCAAFRTYVGAADLAAGKAFVIEEFAGKDKTFVSATGTTLAKDGTYAVVRMGDFSDERRADDTYGWQADADILLNLLTVPGDNPPEMMRRAANLQDTVVAQMQAQFRQTSPFVAPVAGLLNPGPIFLADDTRANRLHLVCPIACQFFDL